MKTTVLTIFTALVIVLGIAENTNAATVKNNDETVTVLTDITAISKIEVRGNVELYVSDGDADKVKVYNKYYSQGALIQSKDGVLRITSYRADKLVVWVTANDLREIAAYDNSEVKSFGKISKIDFTVGLYNNASAKLNMDAFTASINVNDNAKVNLSGSVDQYELKCCNEDNVDERNLTVIHPSKKQTATAQVLDIADL